MPTARLKIPPLQLLGQPRIQPPRLVRMPGQAPEPAPAYVALAIALDQLGRLREVG